MIGMISSYNKPNIGLNLYIDRFKASPSSHPKVQQVGLTAFRKHLVLLSLGQRQRIFDISYNITLYYILYCIKSIKICVFTKSCTTLPLHYSMLHHTTFHYIPFHYSYTCIYIYASMALHYITLHYTTLHYIYITLHGIILYHITSYYIISYHFISCHIILCYIIVHYIALNHLISFYTIS